MRNLFILLVATIILTSFVSAEIGEIGPFKMGDSISLPQQAEPYTSCNISTIVSPNSTILARDVIMTKDGINYNYTLKGSYVQEPGRYIVTGVCVGATTDNWSYDFTIKSTSLILIIFIYALAVVFFIATLVVDEEFLVYISGVLWIIGGVYVMINGMDIANNWVSRAIAIVSLGLGFLFTIGAYVYNSYSNNQEVEEE